MRCYLLPAVLAFGFSSLTGCGGASNGGFAPHPSTATASASSQNLLYLPYATGVNVYSYPQGGLEGGLTGFESAWGACTDKRGNVYITDFDAGTITEYEHGGATPIRTLIAPGPNPEGCAVDPLSGNLAVMNFGYDGGGNVAIYRKAKGKPAIYTDPDILKYANCGYDDAGDLFIDGVGAGSNTGLAELRRGSKSLETIGLDYSLEANAPGGIQWDGKYIALSQPSPPRIYRFRISGSTGKLSGTTSLNGATYVRNFILFGNKAIVANQYYYHVYSVRADVRIFKYPSGGNALNVIADTSGVYTGVALSSASSSATAGKLGEARLKRSPAAPRPQNARPWQSY